MTPPSVEEWVTKCNDDYLTGRRVEGNSWGHVRHGLCSGCALLYAAAHAAAQVALARGEERKRAVGYLQVLQANHPHLHDAYRHAELNLQAVLETDWQPITAALRART